MASSSNTEPTPTSPSTSTEPSNPQIEPIRLPTQEEIQAQDIWNNCAVRSVISGVMGGGFGLFMGMLVGSLDNPITNSEMSTKRQIIHSAKQMGSKSLSTAKTFAIMGLAFSAVECVVEKARAKHDIKNPAIAGCVTGAALSGRGGPQAACMGCAGFSAFSVLIEKFMDRQF